MIWVTRAGAKVDRVACPWLITRFVDPEAQFRFVSPESVLDAARALGARSYDTPGADFGHGQGPEGETCTFVTLMRAHGLWGKDAALDALARIVNHADTRPGRSAFEAPEGEGLRALAEGFALTTPDDHVKLERQFPVYDALYAALRRRLGLEVAPTTGGGATTLA
jgi:hypothetical protein